MTLYVSLGESRSTTFSLAASHACKLGYTPSWLSNPPGAVTNSIHTVFAVSHVVFILVFTSLASIVCGSLFSLCVSKPAQLG
jgi:hypothetical protein